MKRLSLILIVSIAFFASCGGEKEDIIFEENVAISDDAWHKDEIVSVNFDVEDTVTRFDLYFNLRTTTGYEWSNIWLFYELIGPDERVHGDTVEFMLADQEGRWLGESSGSIVNNSIKFIQHLHLLDQGKYTMNFTQAMREDELEGVLDVGLKMVPTPKKEN